MGQAQVEAQTLFTGLAIVLSQQLKEAADPIFDPTQTQQGDQRLRLAHATGHGSHQGDRQVGCGIHFVQGDAEQVAVAEGDGLVEINVGERFTERLIRTGKAEHQIFTLFGDATQLDHAAADEPDVLTQQWNPATGRQMHKVAALVGLFKAGPETIRAAGCEDHRAVVRRLARNCMEQHERRGKAAVVLRLRVG